MSKKVEHTFLRLGAYIQLQVFIIGYDTIVQFAKRNNSKSNPLGLG